jgi:hypothetical protein
MDMRDRLELELYRSIHNHGDTTVLAELLTLLSDTQVWNAISDEAQGDYEEPSEEVKTYTKDDVINAYDDGFKAKKYTSGAHSRADRKEWIENLVVK